MRYWRLIPVVLLLIAPGSEGAAIRMTVSPSHPVAPAPVTLTVCRDFPDSCYEYFSSAWTMTGPYSVKTRLVVLDTHQSGYACAWVITPVCGQYALGALSPGRYTVEAEVYVACRYPSPHPFPPCVPRLESATFCFDVGPVSAIWEARRAVPGTACDIRGATVTASFPDGFYIQAGPGGPGMLVRLASHGITAGALVDVRGQTAATPGGEKCVDASAVSAEGSAWLRPIAMGNRDIGGGDWLVECAAGTGQPGVKRGCGLNTTGMFVATTGRVTHVDRAGQFFTIWDGCCPPLGPIEDCERHPGIRVTAPGCAAPPVGSLVRATGVVSCYSSGGDLYPLLRAAPQGGVSLLP